MSLSRHLAGCSVLSQAERSGRGIVTIAAKPEEESQRRWALASASRARRRLQAPQRLQKLRTAVVVEFDRRSRDERGGGVAGACGAERNQPATVDADLHLNDPRVGFEHGGRGSNFGAGGDLKLEGGGGGFGYRGGEGGNGNWSRKGDELRKD